MTRKRRSKIAHKLHKELWNWLAKNPGKTKTNWPDWLYHTHRPLQEQHIIRQTYNIKHHFCFACYISSSKSSCYLCPITWNEENQYSRCKSKGSPYVQWEHIMPVLKYSLEKEAEKEKLKSIALQIAYLPWNYDI